MPPLSYSLFAHDSSFCERNQRAWEGYLLNDNAEPDFLDCIRDPANGFLSMVLPLKGPRKNKVASKEIKKQYLDVLYKA